jgi:hypothetical protein
MELVGELLDHGGFLPKLADLDRSDILTKKNGVIFSVVWMIVLMVVIPAIIGIGSGLLEAQVVSALIGLLSGLMFIIGSLTLLPSARKYTKLDSQPIPSTPATTHDLHGPQYQALPSHQSIPTSAYAPRTGSWRDTNELEPFNLSKAATRPLEKDEEHH